MPPPVLACGRVCGVLTPGNGADVGPGTGVNGGSGFVRPAPAGEFTMLLMVTTLVPPTILVVMTVFEFVTPPLTVLVALVLVVVKPPITPG